MSFAHNDKIVRNDRLNRHFNLLNNEPYSESRSDDKFWSPRADIVELRTKYKVMLDLPGLSEEEVEITIENNILSISGEENCNLEESENSAFYRERYKGRFIRRFNLRNSIDQENIDADFSHGVLTLVLPKTGSDLPKIIRIGSKEPAKV